MTFIVKCVSAFRIYLCESTSIMEENTTAIEEENVLIKRNGKKSKLPVSAYLLFCYCVGLMPAFIIGAHLVYGTVALPLYLKEDSKIALDSESGSWFVSLLSIFLVTGSLFSSLLTSCSKLGRIYSQLISALIVLLGIILFQFASTPVELYIGRIFCGFGSGLLYPASYLLLHEISLPNHRATLAACNILFMNVGSLYFLIIGWIVQLEVLPFCILIPTAIFCIGIVMLPETANFLIQNRQEQLARMNLLKLWKDKDLVNAEIDTLKHKYNLDSNKTEHRFLTKSNLKAITQSSTIMLFTSLSGCDTLYNYSIIIAMMAEIKISGNLVSVILQLLFTLGFSLAPYLLEKFKRKFHYIVTAFIGAIGMFLLSFGLSKGTYEDYLGDGFSLLIFSVSNNYL